MSDMNMLCGVMVMCDCKGMAWPMEGYCGRWKEMYGEG